MSSFTYGVKELDEHFGRALRPGTTILVAGYPGAGKTTFAATICYKNALLGNKALYISLYEHKEKFMAQMSGLGLDFRRLEERGLFKYVKMPLFPGKGAIEEFVKAIMNYATRFKPKIIVIDGITPLIQALGDVTTARPFIQTVLSDIPKIIEGIVVLVADLPFGERDIRLAGIEFVVDIVFIMRYFIITTRVIRVLEIRKVRGAPLSIAEVPYKIAEGEGIKLFFPILPEQISGPSKAFEYCFGIDVLDTFLGPIKAGDLITIFYPPHARSMVFALAPLLKLITINGLRTAIISLKYSPAGMKEFLHMIARKMNLSKGSNLDKLIYFQSLNPTTMSFQELYFMIDDMVAKIRPRMLVIHGFETLYKLVVLSGTGLDRLYLLLYNKMLQYKSAGLTTVYLTSLIDRGMEDLMSMISDGIVKIDYVYEDKMLKPYITLWKLGCEPKRIDGLIVLNKLGIPNCTGSIRI